MDHSLQCVSDPPSPICEAFAHTSHAITPGCPSCQAFQPLNVVLRLLQYCRMSFLKYFVYGDERLECLNLVRQYRLPVRSRRRQTRASYSS